MIEVEVEDDAWRQVEDVERVVEHAAEAALAVRSRHPPTPMAGRPHMDLKRSLPLDGGGAGVAVYAPRATQKAFEAPPEPLRGRPALTPIPDPSPIEGEGRSYATVLLSTGTAHVTVLLTDDAAIRDLNARFRGKDTPTNVLSFPAAETARPHLGDIALAHGVCAAEAAAQGKALADHLSHLVVHGVLHLLGYDHGDDGPAEAMEAMERDILSGLGVADPYRQERAHAGS